MGHLDTPFRGVGRRRGRSLEQLPFGGYRAGFVCEYDISIEIPIDRRRITPLTGFGKRGQLRPRVV
jgi:hypothetical protein